MPSPTEEIFVQRMLQSYFLKTEVLLDTRLKEGKEPEKTQKLHEIYRHREVMRLIRYKKPETIVIQCVIVYCIL